MKYLLIPFACVAFSASAQMSAEQGQKLQQLLSDPNKMNALLQFQQCVGAIPNEERDALMRKGQQVGYEINRLCKAGDEPSARSYAMKEGMAMQGNPTVIKMKQFHSYVSGMPMPSAMLGIFNPQQLSNPEHNVCDYEESL